MRIVNRDDFLQMPEGTVYSYYVPQVADGLMIKGETWTNDWLYQDLLFQVDGQNSEEISDILYEAEKTGKSFKLDLKCGSRDGMFFEDQLYMVYENFDIEAVVEALKGCIRPQAPESTESPSDSGSRKGSGGSYE